VVAGRVFDATKSYQTRSTSRGLAIVAFASLMMAKPSVSAPERSPRWGARSSSGVVASARTKSRRAAEGGTTGFFFVPVPNRSSYS